MAYRALILRAHTARIAALSAKSSSLFSPLINDRFPQPRLLQSNSRKFCVRTAATNRQSRVDSIKNAIAIVRGVVAIIGGAIGIVFGIKQLDERVLSDLPSKPSHFFQPRKKEVRELEEKFRTLEKTNPGNVAKTVYITGDPATGKTQLASEYGRKFFESSKHKNKKLFVGRLSGDNYSNFLQSYLQVAHDLSCVKEETEKAIESHQLDELASLRMVSKHVKKALRERTGWLLIIDGLSLDEKLVKELCSFWPQPNDENWGKGCVLVTTQDHAPTGSSIAILDLRGGMSEKDAVKLLTRVSGCSDEEGTVELVNSLDRSPLSVAR